MKPSTETPRHPETTALLALTERPYDEYNQILPQIKERLEKYDRNYLRVATFERILEEELPLTTARRAFSTSIRIAMGEKDVPREYVAPKPKFKKSKSVAKTPEVQHGKAASKGQPVKAIDTTLGVTAV